MIDIRDFNKLNEDKLKKKRVFKKFNLPLVYALATIFLNNFDKDSWDTSKEIFENCFKKTNRLSLLQGEIDENYNYKQTLDFLKKVEELDEEFHPTNSVLGGFLSQEIQKIVTRKGRPFHGLFTYDIVTQKGDVYSEDFMHNLV